MKPANITRLALAVASASVVSGSAVAQAQDEPYLLEQLVVTAAGIGVDPLTAPASVSVVTAQDLETQGITSLGEALRNVPGVATIGSAGGEDISVRGLPAEYTLILVDGKRLNTRPSRTNGTGGVDPFHLPPVSSIDRIEVVRGPMSSLHGSDAMGGVINIITKSAAERWSGSITVESTFPQDEKDSAHRQLSFYATGPIMPEVLGLQIWGRGSDRSASEREGGPGEQQIKDLRGRVTLAPNDAHEFTAELGYTGIESDPRLNDRLNGGLGYEGSLAGWDVDADLFYEHAGRETEGSLRHPEISNTVLDAKASRGFEWLGHHDLTLGGQYTHSSLSDHNPGLGDDVHHEFSNSQFAAYGENIWEVSPDFSLTFGTRFIHDERFGSKLTPRVYALWEFADGVFLSGGVSSGYRTPELRQFVEDYYYTTKRGAAVIRSNPDLLPEESITYEAGLRFERGDSRFSVTGFQTDFKNHIESFDTGETIVVGNTEYELYEYYNVGEARIRGVELTAAHAFTPDIRASLSYTYTQSERLTGLLAGEPLSATPLHSASLRLDWATPVEGLDLWGEVRYSEESVAVSSTSRGSSITHYDPYTTLDLGAVYAFNENVTFKASVQNVTNAEITDEEHGRLQNGRTFWAALTTEF
ncbi:TonB-dependent receptor domain-containing protein [Nitratireductor basaltis]|uniref:TonB-dependent receptor, plug n=1 Tax=Nitratireductor basaltis TaxID=472175 RepID=A0A084U9F3_9HYPH|nr:TonB-dependent receptor [Nitratireductor basaltis]KFB09589.1 TonB-dependent receptor, plug [Nitratireductor basaltis]